MPANVEVSWPTETFFQISNFEPVTLSFETAKYAKYANGKEDVQNQMFTSRVKDKNPWCQVLDRDCVKHQS
jgi:hypothetical protein